MNTVDITNKISTLEEELKELKQLLEDTSQEEENSLRIPEMVKIPTRSYSLGKYPVTVREYQAFLKETAPDKITEDLGDPTYPMRNVSHSDALEYITWLNNKTGRKFRLPTEDEWEYCCADHQEANKDIAYYNANDITHVGTKEPNEFGLYDMLGLIWEWTSSRY